MAKILSSLVVLLLILAAVPVTSYFLQKGHYSTTKSLALGTETGPIPTQPVLFEEHFDGPESLSKWKLNQNGTTNKISITNTTYKGSGGLMFDYSDYSQSQFLKAERTIDPGATTNVVARTAFYDDMSTTKGTGFLVTSTGSENTGIIVSTTTSAKNYLFRINVPSQMLDTGVARSPGWHIFELIVTEKGTYGKIDNAFLYKPDRTLFVNATQTKTSAISFVSTWGLYGKTIFDEVTVARMDNLSSGDQIFRVAQNFYSRHKNTDFSPLYIDLGQRIHANDLRGLLNTAITFYAYGKRVSDPIAVARAKSLFADALKYGHWEQENGGKYWARGAYLSELSGALNLLRPDLDSTTMASAKNILFKQVQAYIFAKENFESPLTGWQSTSVPSTNTATVVAGKGKANSSGLVINYTNGAGSNLVNIKKPLAVFADAPSLKATIWFYDDLSPSKGVMFLLSASNSSSNTGIGVNTSISRDYYLFRINVPNNMKPTSVKRSLGWHEFSLVESSNCCGLPTEKIGITGYIDGQKVGLNSTQLFADAVQIVSTWGLTGTSIFDDLLVTRMPETGKTLDTKAEENGWHALVLAETTNFFPDVPNRDVLSALAKCYAYHSITVSADQEFCQTKTVTASDGFRFDNHGILNPSYQAAVLGELIRAGYSFSSTQKPIPTEFTHNLTPAIKSFLTFVDTNNYQFINSPSGDWTGVTNTPYQHGEAVILFAAKSNLISFNLADFISKRSIMFYDVVSNYWKDNPASIPTFNQGDLKSPGYMWWADSIVSAESLLLASYPSI